MTPALRGDFTEPGRWVDDTGVIRYAWPPEGRFADLWRRVTEVTTEEERIALQTLIHHEVDANSTLVAYQDDEGEWHDVEPNWEEPKKWT